MNGIVENDPNNFDALNDLLSQMCSTLKLDRDKASERLREFVPGAEVSSLDQLLEVCFSKIESQSIDDDWHTLFGCIVTYRVVLEAGQLVSVCGEDRLRQLLQLCNGHLSHPEPRVRVALGELLGVACGRCGVVVMETVWPRLSALIQSALHADETASFDVTTESDTASTGSRDSSDVFANTSSWTQLETSLRCLERLVSGGDVVVSADAVELVLASLDHTNRFVREAVFVCLSAFLHDSDNSGTTRVSINLYGQQICHAIARGMDDNWSQVRMAASVAGRKLICFSSPDFDVTVFHSVLVPRVCLNRYYVAEGVKIYNQKTWEIISESRGRELVQTYLDDILTHYITCSRAENHAVREAACYCVSELVRKLPASALSRHVAQLLDALLVCFHDDSWPVRDTACLAVGNLVSVFSDASAPYMDRLLPLMFDNLFDNIPSVREGGAESLAKVAASDSQRYLEIFSNRLSEGLVRVREQAEDVEAGVEMEPVAGASGTHMVRRLRAGTAASDKHTDQTMYSCGSLAPKMRAGGCSASHHFRRAPHPWEETDGCIRLLAQLAAVDSFQQLVCQLLPLAAGAASSRQYPQHVQLVATLCSAVTRVAHALGKRPFKAHLELFLDPLFYAVKCDNRLTADSAVSCVRDLSQFLGAGIFRGRVELHNARYLELLDRIMC